jgi:hypothetical protein
MIHHTRRKPPVSSENSAEKKNLQPTSHQQEMEVDMGKE